MSWKTVTVLAALLAGLGAFYYYDTYHLTPAREKREQAKGRLWSVEPKDVQSLTIVRKAETLRVRRVEGGWEMLEPVAARGDRGTIDGIVTGLATIRVDREVDPDPSKPAEFGLEPPAAEVRLEVQGRPDPLILHVGGKNPTGVWTYGREGGKTAVLALPDLLSRDTSRPVADFRDKTVLAFDRKAVTAVDFEIERERIRVEAEEGGTWKITQPRAYRADADLIADFLQKLESARVKEFTAERATSLARYGLDRPARVTVWTGRDKERTAKTLALGRVEADKQGVYVMRAEEPGVMLVGPELWTALPKTVAILRDKVVVAYAYDKVVKLELAHARGLVTIEREGTGWKITAPEALKADGGQVNGLLWKIRDLRAAGYVAEEARDIPRFLAKPDVTVRIWEEGAAEPRVLLLGASRETRGGKPAAVAAVAAQGPVVLVDATALADLSKTAHDLRDRTLFPAFELGDVQRARIAAGDARLVVERSGSDWRTVEPARGRADDLKVSDLLLTLKALRWKEIVSAAGDDPARFGLDRPHLEVTVSKSGGAEVDSLLVGKEEGGVTYVRLKSGPAIYSVESKVIGDIRRAQTEIPA
jgi:hypothetical protein